MITKRVRTKIRKKIWALKTLDREKSALSTSLYSALPSAPIMRLRTMLTTSIAPKIKK
jgi:hypothetical protein